MFGRKKTQQQTGSTHQDRPGAKNRPTPKRRDQEAARVRPLVPTDRKGARNQDREARRAVVALQRQAMLTGDERHMPARDAGPVRRYIRDYVDARRSGGEFLLPVMLVFLGFSFVKVAAVFFFVTIGIYTLMLISIVDAVLMWRRLKKTLIARFGADQIPRGAAMYAGMRAFQLRPLRMPKPQVKRGDPPR